MDGKVFDQTNNLIKLADILMHLVNSALVHRMQLLMKQQPIANNSFIGMQVF